MYLNAHFQKLFKKSTNTNNFKNLLNKYIFIIISFYNTTVLFLFLLFVILVQISYKCSTFNKKKVFKCKYLKSENRYLLNSISNTVRILYKTGS